MKIDVERLLVLCATFVLICLIAALGRTCNAATEARAKCIEAGCDPDACRRAFPRSGDTQ